MVAEVHWISILINDEGVGPVKEGEGTEASDHHLACGRGHLT